MHKALLTALFLFPTSLWADLDAALSAYNRDDFDRAIRLAEEAHDPDAALEDRILARELIALSHYYQGVRGTMLLAEMQALDLALKTHYGRDAEGRLEILGAISDLHAALGQTDAAIGTEARIVRRALAATEGSEDALFALRNIALLSQDADARTALFHAALFEFHATELRGMADPWSVEAVGRMALALLRNAEDARAAQRFLQYPIADWQAFAGTGPDAQALVDRLFEAFESMTISDEAAWFARIEAEGERVAAADARFAEAWALLEAGQSPLAPEFLAAFEAYLALAAPEDPIAAIYATTIMRNHLETGDFARARPYLSLILSYPATFIAILDLPIGYSAGILAMQGGVEDALFAALVDKALDAETIVEGDNPEMLFDLSLSLGDMHARRGNPDAAYDAYRAAMDLAARSGLGDYAALGAALQGAAMALNDLGRFEAALAVLDEFRAFGARTGDDEAVASAMGTMAWVAQAMGDAPHALALARQRLTFEQGRADPDAALVQLARFNLVAIMLAQSGPIDADLVDVLTDALSGPAHGDLAAETRAGLLTVVAERLNATPETIVTHAAFRGADAAQRAGLITLLGEASMGRGDTRAARAWVDVGAGLAADGSEEMLRLMAVWGRAALAEGDARGALAVFRRITDDRLRPAMRGREGATDHVPYHLAAAHALSRDPAEGADPGYRAEMFEIAQLANMIMAGGALNATLARDGTEGAVADLLRRRDLVAREIAEIGDAVAQARYDGKSPGRMLARQDALAREHAALSADIGAGAPDLIDMAGAAPVALAEVAARLRPDEVLVQYVTSDAMPGGAAPASYLIAMNDRSVLVAEIPGRTALADLARTLRCSAALTDPNCAAAGIAATRGSFSIQVGAAAAAGPSFDTDAAHLAHAQLIAPMAALLAGRDRLIVVPDQTLLSLPFHLTLQSPHAPGRSLADADWLIRAMSIEIAPSVRSFVALRDTAREDAREGARPRRFFGVGDPLIGTQKHGPTPFECGTETAVVLASAVPSVLQRSSGAARVGLISDMAALPDARCELSEIAARFDDSLVLLHEDATETALKRLSVAGALRDFSVLSFATHGLVAGEIGVNDSGLVLTPPRLPTAQDDGLLTTAEIAGLDLDADFVVLSACNTASGDSRSDEGLSGMASAFFSAGADSLLVSHWPVYSDAAVALTTGLFDGLRRAPGTARAEALRQAMLAVLDDPASGPRERHPAYWGAFMIVGDGLGAPSR